MCDPSTLLRYERVKADQHEVIGAYYDLRLSHVWLRPGVVLTRRQEHEAVKQLLSGEPAKFKLLCDADKSMPSELIGTWVAWDLIPDRR